MALKLNSSSKKTFINLEVKATSENSKTGLYTGGIDNKNFIDSYEDAFQSFGLGFTKEDGTKFKKGVVAARIAGAESFLSTFIKPEAVAAAEAMTKAPDTRPGYMYNLDFVLFGHFLQLIADNLPNGAELRFKIWAKPDKNKLSAEGEWLSQISLYYFVWDPEQKKFVCVNKLFYKSETDAKGAPLPKDKKKMQPWSVAQEQAAKIVEIISASSAQTSQAEEPPF